MKFSLVILGNKIFNISVLAMSGITVCEIIYSSINMLLVTLN